MRAFVAEIDHTGIRRFVPEDSIPADDLRGLVRRRSSRQDTLVWTLLDDGDAEAIRVEVETGRHRRACGLLLNRAVELLSLAAAMPGPAHTV